MKRKYPAGTTFTDWFLSGFGKSDPHIRREIRYPGQSKTAIERHNKASYRHLLDAYGDRELDEQADTPGAIVKPPRALTDYIIRLNGKDPIAERLREKCNYDHAWINDELLQQYRQDEIYSCINDRTNADALFGYLNRYALHWFITLKRLHSPLQWKAYEKEWGRYLMNKKEDESTLKDDLRIFRDKDTDKHRTPKNRQLSAKVLKNTVYEMNRFVRYVYKKRRNEFENELVEIEPWGDALIKTYASDWKIKNKRRLSKYIKVIHWQTIKERMKKENVPWRHQVGLAYDYGLRRNETMGLETDSVRPQYLHLTKQLKKITKTTDEKIRTFKPLKGRETERKIEHWFVDPKETQARIRLMLTCLSHPDTISKGFINLCKRINKEEQKRKKTDKECFPTYWFHDLRRTFITNAVKAEKSRYDLQLAIGHKSERVLNQFYLMDARELEDDFDMGDDEDFDI
jgi:hypothetical protein